MTTPGTNGKPVDPVVEAEVDRLKTMPIAQLRMKYRKVFRAEPPKAFGPDLLRRSIAYRIQENAYGGLPRETRRLLNQLIKAYWKNPGAKLELPRRIKPGSELVRTWKGKVYKVIVLADGFAYQGITYSSLSEIAFRITGTKWNGPRFFGLRSTVKAAAEAAGASESPPDQAARRQIRPQNRKAVNDAKPIPRSTDASRSRSAAERRGKPPAGGAHGR